MCLCLPNGKFTLNLCIGKKSARNKHDLFNDIIEDEDNKELYDKNNGIDNKLKLQLDKGQNQRHYRQLSRQLPPVPPDLQGNQGGGDSPDKATSAITRSNVDLCFTSNVAEDFSHQFLTYSPRKCFDIPNFKNQALKDSESIYTKVEPKNKFKNPSVALINPSETYEYDSSAGKHDNIYSMVAKNQGFNSLRKPIKSYNLSTNQCFYQSLQTLNGGTNGEGPSIPNRQYSPYELPEIFGTKFDRKSTGNNDSKDKQVSPNIPGEVRIRNPSSSSSILRRFSQPITSNQTISAMRNNNGNVAPNCEGIDNVKLGTQKDCDILKNLQSQYNSPPINRVSIADISARDLDPSPHTSPYHHHHHHIEDIDTQGSVNNTASTTTNTNNSEKTEDAVYSIPHKLPIPCSSQFDSPSKNLDNKPSLLAQPPSALNTNAINVYEIVDEMLPPLPQGVSSLGKRNPTKSNRTAKSSNSNNLQCKISDKINDNNDDIIKNNNNSNNNIGTSNNVFSGVPSPPTACVESFANTPISTPLIPVQSLPSTSAEPQPQNPVYNQIRTSNLPLTHNPVAPFLGHDNYISISDNPTMVARSVNNNNNINTNNNDNNTNTNVANNVISASNNIPLNAPINNVNNAGNAEKQYNSSYYTFGSDVYAEISDVYQYRHYEELPDTNTNNSISNTSGGPATTTTRPSSATGSRTHNSTAVLPHHSQQSQTTASSPTGISVPDPSASPGSLRVLLEIQSFRHMDSDVDISSFSTNPHHQSNHANIINLTNALPSTSSCNKTNIINKPSQSSQSNSALKNHPWFLPPPPPPTNQNGSNSRSSISTTNNPVFSRTTNHMMTPVMERSVEGSASIFSNNASTHTTATTNTTNTNNKNNIDNLYDLFRLENSKDTKTKIIYPKY